MADEFLHPEKKSRFSSIFTNVALSILLIGGVVFGYEAFWPQKIFTVNSAVVTTPVVKAGGVLEVKFNYCDYTEQQGIVYRVLQSDKTSINLPNTVTISKPGCHVTTIFVPIIAGVPPGKYVLYDYAVFQVNPIRTQRAPFYTNSFQITN